MLEELMPKQTTPEQPTPEEPTPEEIRRESDTTIFRNIRYVEDGSRGEIKTVSEFRVWDAYRKKWSDKPFVVFRNIMLCALYPTKDFCLTEISKTETNPTTLDAFKPVGDKKAWFLDLASGARTHGRFTFTRESTVGKLYYGTRPTDQWKRIIYGSIIHTGCKKLIYKQMKYIVVDDENTFNGNPLDDPVNGIHWETGDSHAKGSSELMRLLEISTAEQPADGEIPIQFRASLRSLAGGPGWVGKGTISYNPLCDTRGVDLVIPLSSLKGNKPELGNYEDKLLIGTVFEAEERKTKLGWMIWQWFAFETLEQDNIISNLREKAQRLGDAFNSIENLAEILRVDQKEKEAEQEQSADGLTTDAYKTPVLRIIQADRRGILLLHPYVIARVKDGIQEMWLNLAKSAGVKFHSVMAQPDESLAHYHVVQPDGAIVGRKVFCSGSFPPGEYIVYCNPMRHWGDIQLWENRHEGAYVRAIGTIAAPRALLASLGRDTDGDFIQLIKADRYPGLRATIANFDRPPAVAKFPKVALPGTLQQIAIRSMSDLTGVVASLLGRAKAVNAEQQVLVIPPGGEQREPKEMRIIEFLSQELQIAVDSLKSAYPNNENGIRAVTEYLNSVGAEAPWLRDFKNDSCYRDRPCSVNENATDTVSRIVQLVNSYFRSPSIGMDSSPRSYENTLFTDVPHTREQYDYAIAERNRYRSEMANADAESLREGGDDAYIVKQLASEYKKQVANNFREKKDSIYEILSPAGEKYSPISWVSAYWKASHQAETGTAGFVFSVFVDEIVEKLKEMEERPLFSIEVYAVQYSAWKMRKFTGQRARFRVALEVIQGKQRLVFYMKSLITEMEFIRLGIASEKDISRVTPGQTFVMRICTHRMKGGVMSSARLFSEETTYEHAIQHVATSFYREQWPD